MLFVGLCLVIAGLGVARQLHIIWHPGRSADGMVTGGKVEEFTQIPTWRGGVPVRRFRPRVEFKYIVGCNEYTKAVPSDSGYGSYEAALKHLLGTFPQHNLGYGSHIR